MTTKALERQVRVLASHCGDLANLKIGPRYWDSCRHDSRQAGYVSPLLLEGASYGRKLVTA